MQETAKASKEQQTAWPGAAHGGVRHKRRLSKGGTPLGLGWDGNGDRGEWAPLKPHRCGGMLSAVSAEPLGSVLFPEVHHPAEPVLTQSTEILCEVCVLGWEFQR